MTAIWNDDKFNGNVTVIGTTTLGATIYANNTIAISGGLAATNAALGNIFYITANANFTLSNPTNVTDGQRIESGVSNRMELVAEL